MEVYKHKRLIFEWLKGAFGNSERSYVCEEPINPKVAALDGVNYVVCVNEHRYRVLATPGFLGCIVVDELNQRSKELVNGPFCHDTWRKIENAIALNEIAPFGKETAS